MMKSTDSPLNFYSRAKLMITGEYLVLRGAQSLSIPLKYGQSLSITEHTGTASLVWKTLVKGHHWFDAVFSLDEFAIGNTNDFPTAQNLRELLLAAKILKPAFLNKNVRYEAISSLDFDISWGFGSSSSLLVNIARWAKVDPFVLFSWVFAGSGYDVAVAMSEKPILYNRTLNDFEINQVDFYPPFQENLYFVYLGKKRISSQAVQAFSQMEEQDFSKQIRETNAITQAMISATGIHDFRKLMREHERIISGILGIPPLSEKTFSDFSGDAKSLGAWGGDFVLLATDMPREYVISWLRKKDLNTWFTYKDLALPAVK